ncbi:MAG: hypothetical protein Kow0092_32850 [Deferrisomatales bacterium]
MGSMKPILALAAVLLAVAAAVSAPVPARAGGTIRLTSTAEVEVTRVDEEGRTAVERVPAAKVVPGEVVLYTNRYENVGEQPAENVVITNPVPEHMTYVAGSAFGEGTRITFSVDGGARFDLPENLTVIGPDGRPRPASAEEYTHVRWARSRPVEPGETGAVGFRARLN